MSVPLSPSELHSLLSGLDLTRRNSDRGRPGGAESNRQWTAGEFGSGSAQALWAIEGFDVWQDEFRRRLLEVFSQTHQPAWDAQPQPGTAIRLHHFVAANRLRQAFRIDSLIPGTPVWVVFDPHLVATHLDLMLGATESLASPASLPALTPVKMGPLEIRLFQRCVSSVCHALTHSTGPHELQDFPNDPLTVDDAWIAGIPINLTSVLANLEFRLRLGEYSGNLNIAMTREGLQSLIPLRGLTSALARQRNPMHTDSVTIDSSGTHSLAPESTLRVILARATLTTQELTGLQVGDVLLTSQETHSPCEVWVDGVPRFEAAAVTFQDHKAVHLMREVPAK
ncbi:MAG: Flagellar motor switch protein FliM [Planctomycetaceae bacterium]|nr:Flagellar motor switch protein FliM [Planctomycetaceae bacterium]